MFCILDMQIICCFLCIETNRVNQPIKSQGQSRWSPLLSQPQNWWSLSPRQCVLSNCKVISDVCSFVKGWCVSLFMQLSPWRPLVRDSAQRRGLRLMAGWLCGDDNDHWSKQEHIVIRSTLTFLVNQLYFTSTLPYNSGWNNWFFCFKDIAPY